MEEIKMSRKHFSKLGGMFVIGTLVIYAVQILCMTLAGVFRPDWLYDPNISLMLSMIPMYLVGIPILILLVKRIPAENVEQHSIKPGQFIVAVIMTLGAAYIANFLGTMITTAVGLLKGSEVTNVVAEITTSTNMALTFLFMVLCAPVIEEYVFRKLIVDRTVRYGQGTAVLLSGLMFGLFHGNLNQFVYAFVLGAFLAFLYAKTGKLRVTIAIHMIMNFIGAIVSALLLEAIDYDQYLRMAAEELDMEVLMPYIMEHLAGWIGYILYMIAIFGMMIAAGVLFIVFIVKKRFVFDQGQVVIPRGKRFSTVFLNLGMIVYCLFWICMIVYQLLG